jgi:uncharacterized protein (UPF0332 family)
MKDTTAKFLAKAERAIRAAEKLRTGDDVEFAAGRAYYAMLYVGEALLEEQGLRYSKHAGVHAAFGQHFAKAGLLDAKYHRWLLAAFNKRLTDDYGIEAVLTAADADEMIAQAREFLQAARQFLGVS